MTPKPSQPDEYSRLQYRRLIAWPERMRREAALLDRVLSSGPKRRVLDLGCGPGEHSRFLASLDYEVVGVDASESMIETATQDGASGNPRFVLGDLRRLEDSVTGLFGGAICLGNTLPHLREKDDLEAFLGGLRRCLVEEAPILIQLLNYERILSSGERHLPLNFRPGAKEGEELVFLRLMKPRDDGSVLFFPTTLRWHESGDSPVEVVASKRVVLRAWTWDVLGHALEVAGFPRHEVLGGFDEGPFDPERSRDLIVIAR